MKILQIVRLSIFILMSIGVSAQEQSSEYITDVQNWQNKQNLEFKTPNETPLTQEGITVFKGLDFYKIDSKFRVVSNFKRTPNEPVFGMPTTTSRLPEYKKYGVATFEIDGETFELNVYQNQKAMNIKGYEDYLFIPFTDLTSGDSSYSGGRYIDLQIPEGDEILIDFNKSYNPYCAYNHKYSCPIPPSENFLNIRIEAGVMSYNDLGNKSHK